EKIVRVVFDMDAYQMYRVESDHNTISLIFSDKSTSKFETWSTIAVVSPNKKVEQKSYPIKNKEVAVTDKSNKVLSKSTAELNRSINKDRLLSLQGTAAKATEKSPSKSKTTGTPQLTTAKKKDLKPTVNNKNNKVKSSTTETPKSIKKKTSTKLYTSQKADGPEFDLSLIQEEKELQKSKAASLKTVKKTVSSNKTGKVTVAKADVSNKNKQKAVTVLKTPLNKKSETAKEITKVVTSKESSPKTIAKAAVKKDTKKKTKKNSPKVAKRETTKKQKKIVKSPQKTKKNSKLTQSTPDKKTSSKKKSTSRFRRSPLASKKIKGTMVAEFPRRLVIKYKTKSYRDPFETLINESKTYNSPIEKKVPNVEGLKLVGIIESISKDNRALFEDNDGYGYILKTGDKVQKGYVLRVENDRVYFQIFEYGWSRTVALNLES
ncbi:MAG: hypothetical protein ACE5D6_02705, partial [Candidatus Zixiibacteriota bacterium]